MSDSTSSDETLVLFDPIFLEHDPGERHPDSAERLRRILGAFTPLPSGARLLLSCERAPLGAVLRVHSESYVEGLLEARGRSAVLDDDTRLSPASVDAAFTAAGAGMQLVDALLDGSARNGFALVRPPGHHALADRAMGYCVINNVAVAAAHALARGVDRLMIVDWDVHHGNGTEEIFFESAQVLFVDFHQDRLFPEGGGAEDVGQGLGQGYTINVPLPADGRDADYAYAAERLLPALGEWYRPQLILVSAGFDAHARDPEGGMQLTPAAFGALTRTLKSIAERVCDGRLGLVLEGGYSPADIGACARACLDALVGSSQARSATGISATAETAAMGTAGAMGLGDSGEPRASGDASDQARAQARAASGADSPPSVRSAVQRVVEQHQALHPQIKFPAPPAPNEVD